MYTIDTYIIYVYHKYISWICIYIYTHNINIYAYIQHTHTYIYIYTCIYNIYIYIYTYLHRSSSGFHTLTRAQATSDRGMGPWFPRRVSEAWPMLWCLVIHWVSFSPADGGTNSLIQVWTNKWIKVYIYIYIHVSLVIYKYLFVSRLYIYISINE